MASLDLLKASAGTGEAVRAIVTVLRSAASSTLSVDSLSNWPAKFICTSGTLLSSGAIDPASVTVFHGHTNVSQIIIDGYAPGYTDVGNSVGQVVVVKPATYWADQLNEFLATSLNNNGTFKDDSINNSTMFSDPVDPVLRTSESSFDYVASGCVLTGTGYGSTLGWSLTAGVVYIGGDRYTVAAATGTVTATKDTYFDILKPASGTVATLVNTGGNVVTVNAASPALAANSIRIGIIQSGANIASVAAINQGQENKVLPIASSIPYAVTDSLGNLICPRDPERKILGYRQIITDFTATTLTAITGLNLNCIVPSGRKVRVSGFIGLGSSSAANNGVYMDLVDVTNSNTVLAAATGATNASGDVTQVNPSRIYTPGSTTMNFKAQMNRGSNAATAHSNGSATNPNYIMVELV